MSLERSKINNEISTIGRKYFKCQKCGKDAHANNNTKRLSEKLCSSCFGKRKDVRKKELNDLTGKQWARASRSIEKYPDFRSEKQKIHGASFPKSLALQQIEIYTKSNQTVFDPFLGVGTTLDAAEEIGRNGIGIDLNPEFIKIANKDLKSAKQNMKIICADARLMLKYLNDASADFLLTSPPYANLLKTVKGNFAYKWREHSTIDPIKNPTPYSSSEKDFGNMNYDEYLLAIEEVMSLTSRVLKPSAYSVWIVKDFRDLKKLTPYVNLHSDIIRCAENVGFKLWDIRIYDQTTFRPLVCLGYPSKNFYLNIGHSYILVFRNNRDSQK